MKASGLTRRDLLGLAGAAAAGAATATGAGGCAILPRGGAGEATTHRCDHRYCRFYREVGNGGAPGGFTVGRCALEARVAGGQP